MSRPNRGLSSSRAIASRPQRLAGRAPVDTGQAAPTDAKPSATTNATPTRPGNETGASDQVERRRRLTRGAQTPTKADAPGDLPARPDTRWFSSQRLTRALAVLAVLVGALMFARLEGLGTDLHGSDERPPTPAGDGSIPVSAGRPVLLAAPAAQEGVDAAAKAAEEIVSASFDDYDREVDRAAALMTDDFAEEYRQTAGDVADEFVAQHTIVQARVVGQGVVRANESELQALVFLNHYVTKGRGQHARTTYTPYRAVVTVVHTDDGWLVDGIDTK